VHECGWHSKPFVDDAASYYEVNNLDVNITNQRDYARPCDNEGRFQRLFLSGNDTQGTLPPELFLLTSLQTLELINAAPEVNGANRNWTGLTGSIPSEIDKCTNFTNLQFGGHDLIVNLTLMAQLSSLQKMAAAGCIIDGTEITKLSNLTFLNLDQSEVRGTIPSELGAMSALQVIKFDRNLLSGTIPSDLGRLTELRAMMLSRNKPNGTMPSELGHLSELFWFCLNWNKMKRTVPPEFRSVGATSGHLLMALDSNLMTGTLPTELGKIDRLLLNPESNLMSGTLPSEFGQNKGFLGMGINSNLITGTVPTEFGAPSSCLAHELQFNQISGTIPSQLGKLSEMMALDLSDNQLMGAIPSDLGRASNLVTLGFDGNFLTGSIPSELGAMASLQWVSM